MGKPNMLHIKTSTLSEMSKSWICACLKKRVYMWFFC